MRILAVVFSVMMLGADTPLSAVLIEGEGWKRVGPSLGPVTALASDAGGSVFIAEGKELHKLLPWCAITDGAEFCGLHAG